MPFEPREFLRHILAEAEYLTTISASLTTERATSCRTGDSCVRTDIA
jgi:hypothetical protein